MTTKGQMNPTPRVSFTVRPPAQIRRRRRCRRRRPFVRDGWNVFDVLVVSLSLAALGPVNVPVNVIRSARAGFRPQFDRCSTAVRPLFGLFLNAV
jgi:hypothetical protein